MEGDIDRLCNKHEDWLGTRHDWLGLCPTIPNLGYMPLSITQATLFTSKQEYNMNNGHSIHCNNNTEGTKQ